MNSFVFKLQKLFIKIRLVCLQAGEVMEILILAKLEIDPLKTKRSLLYVFKGPVRTLL
jgi:hypothetical protein